MYLLFLHSNFKILFSTKFGKTPPKLFCRVGKRWKNLFKYKCLVANTSRAKLEYRKIPNRKHGEPSLLLKLFIYKSVSWNCITQQFVEGLKDCHLLNYWKLAAPFKSRTSWCILKDHTYCILVANERKHAAKCRVGFENKRKPSPFMFSWYSCFLYAAYAKRQYCKNLNFTNLVCFLDVFSLFLPCLAKIFTARLFWVERALWHHGSYPEQNFSYFGEKPI